MTKVTDFNPNGLPVALGGWSTGYSSIGSNTDANPPLSALNFVQRITANTSNVLLNPIVNFASGSNILLTLDAGPANSIPSNTIRIHSTGGGSGGTISAGSNSTAVQEISTAGASSTLWSPFDHAHAGVQAITSSSSNTLQKGLVNLRAGTNVAFGLTDSDGDGEFDTLTVSATATGGGGGGGGGLTQSYKGYNTIGASWVTVTGLREYMKKITLGATSHLQSMDIYVRPSVDNLYGIHVGMLTDNAGSPQRLIAGNTSGASGFYMSESGSMPGAGRWLSIPLTGTFAAGDYWLALMGEFARFDIANDAGAGADRYFTTTLFTLSAPYPTAFPVTTTTDAFSIRLSIFS